MPKSAASVVLCSLLMLAAGLFAYGPTGHAIAGAIAGQGRNLLPHALSGTNSRATTLAMDATDAASKPAPLASATPASSPSPSPSPSITPKAPTPPPQYPNDPVYGEYPAKYKDIIMDWLFRHLHDPLSAKVEWQTEPKRADLPGPNGRKLHGYLVLFTVNARNQFGTATGRQTHGALIHNDEVIRMTGFAYAGVP